MEKTMKIAPLGLSFADAGEIDKIKGRLRETTSGRCYFNIPVEVLRDLKIESGQDIYAVVYGPPGPVIMLKRTSGYGNGVRIMISQLDKDIAELVSEREYDVLIVPWKVKKS